MESRALLLIVFLGVICVAQGTLKCNNCTKIDRDNPICDTMNEIDCSSGYNNCIRIKLSYPAYGEVRRCAKDIECDAPVPPQVDKHCCTTDLCN